MSTHVHFALLQQFKGDPTLLLLGSPSAFASLAKRLETAQLQSESTLSDAELGATGHRGFSLLLRSAEEGAGVMLDPARPLVIEWLVSPSAKQQVVEQLRVLAEPSVGPAHHFLETWGDVQVIASTGEYPVEVLDQQD